MKQNIKLTVAYDGSAYLGWQKTKMGPSIEAALQQALEQILQQPIALQAASRTDAGVHAQGQIVNFFSEKNIGSLTKFQISLNHLLPKDISVLKVEKAEATFHPTLDNSGKEYHYHICFGRAQLPHRRFYSWHYPYALNLVEMRRACEHIVGKRDFAVFCNDKKNAQYEDYIREVKAIDILEQPEECLLFKITGTHFLYKMVRNIVGTLVYVGRGKIKADEIPHMISYRDRTQAGITAPAHGLILYKITC